MPFFLYQCAACTERLEAFQRISDPPLPNCPHCNGALVRCDEGGASASASHRPFAAAVPWTPLETDVHKGWKRRRKWKRDTIAAWKRDERFRDREDEA